MKKKILTVLGTRPEVIKLAPVIKELEKYPDDFDSVVCATAQHREMLDQALKTFNINLDYDLDIMKSSQSLFDLTSGILTKIKYVFEKEKPEIVLIQGDTTTTFVTGLAAFYLKIPVGHIEAGLRTHKKYSPFPEEINRKLTSSLADYHFAPTDDSRQNLLKEGVSEKDIHVTGNTVIDALFMTVQKGYEFGGELGQFDFSKKIVLVTAHRRENFGEPFEELCFALREIAEKNPDVIVIYPVHLNPKVRQPVQKILSGISNIMLIEPVEYEPFVHLMNKSHLIITDSGGIQEEAPSLGKPTLVMRDSTERPEAVVAGTVKLVGTNRRKICDEATTLLRNPEAYSAMSGAINPYGDGNASKRIISVLHRFPF